MNPRKIWPIVVLLLMTARATTAQDKEEDPHSRVQVKLEMLTWHDGLPGGGALGGLISVGGRLPKQTSIRKDSSGKVVYRRTIEGQSRWLPDNAIEITLGVWVVHQPFWRPSASELSAFGDLPMVSTSSLQVLLGSTR